MMADQRGRDKKGDERELLFQTRNKQKQQQPAVSNVKAQLGQHAHELSK